MKFLTVDNLIQAAVIFVCLVVGIGGGAFIGGAVRDHVDKDRSTQAKFEHVMELLEDAKEERHLYRELAIAIYRHDMHVPETGRKEATKIVDEWVEANRDSVNIDIGFLKRRR